MSDLITDVAHTMVEMEKTQDVKPARIKLGPEAFKLVVESAATPPSEGLVSLVRDYPTTKGVEMLTKAYERYADQLKRGYGAWGKDGSSLFGVPVDCVEDLEGFEVISE